MAEKVTFDPANRLIIVKPGVVSLDVKTDLYSDGKEDWRTDPSLNRYVFPFFVIGGQPLPGGKFAGSTFFLRAGWKIRPQEVDHELVIDGNLYTEDGAAITVPTLGGYTVTVRLQTSNLATAVQTAGPLTSAQEQMLLELYDIFGLDPTKPLIVSTTQRQAGDIVQTIAEDVSGEVTVQRQ